MGKPTSTVMACTPMAFRALSCNWVPLEVESVALVGLVRLPIIPGPTLPLADIKAPDISAGYGGLRAGGKVALKLIR